MGFYYANSSGIDFDDRRRHKSYSTLCEKLNAMKKTSREEGRVEAFISLVKDGVITIEEVKEILEQNYLTNKLLPYFKLEIKV